MARRGLRQADLAEVLHISSGAISQKLTGARPINLAELELIAERIGVPMSVLVDDDPALAGDHAKAGA
jgi:transcriptional regulator with XRE-family HTH domain